MRLSPDVFWRMSLVEWRAALAGIAGPRTRPLARADFARLMEQYPDG